MAGSQQQQQVARMMPPVQVQLRQVLPPLQQVLPPLQQVLPLQQQLLLYKPPRANSSQPLHILK